MASQNNVARTPKERGEEAITDVHEKVEQAPEPSARQEGARNSAERDFEGGFGGQEDLEDRYATTSGEH